MDGTIPAYGAEHAETDSEGQACRAGQGGTNTACKVDGCLLRVSPVPVRQTNGDTNAARAVVARLLSTGFLRHEALEGRGGSTRCGPFRAADRAKQYAQDHPEEEDQATDKAQDLMEGQRADGDREGEKQPQ